MFMQIRARFKRTPLPYLGIALFAVIVSVILCALQARNEKELEDYSETCKRIPVYFSVTSLSGGQSDNLDIPAWLADVFDEDGQMSPKLTRYIGEWHVKVEHLATYLGQDMGEQTCSVFGVTTLALSKEIQPETGVEITWEEGFDEGIFLGKQRVCLVSGNMPTVTNHATGAKEVKLTFRHKDPVTEIIYETKRTLQVAGTYTGSNMDAVYCPYALMKKVYPDLKEDRKVSAIRCKLVDNEMLEDLRTSSAFWYAEPNPMGQKTDWGHMGMPYYLYALDIDDTLLENAKATMETSMTVNRISTVLVFALSVGAGFLVGFLMVRSRKREIALLRTLGTSNSSIYFGFVLEQMLCILAGTFLGGLAFRWRPLWRLGLFNAIYFAGLTLALLVFIRKNLMTSLKEEE